MGVLMSAIGAIVFVLLVALGVVEVIKFIQNRGNNDTDKN